MSSKWPVVGSTGGSRLRPRAVALSAVAGLLMLCGVSQAAPTLRCTPAHDGAWTVLGAPHFTTGAAAVTEYAVSPAGKSVYATNSRSVVRTDDTGCTWKTVYTAATSATGTDQVARIVVLPSAAPTMSAGVARATAPATGKDRLMVVVTSGADAVPQAPLTSVVSSTDSGASWSAKGRVLPGQVLDASATAAGGKTTLYALLRQTPVADTTSGLHAQSGVLVARSDDAGASWSTDALQQTNGPTAAVVSPGAGADSPTKHFTGVVADPTKAMHAWFAAPDGLYETTDGGANTMQASQATSLGTQHLTTSVTSKKQVQVAFAFIGSTRPSVGYSRPATTFNTDVFAAAQLPAQITSLVSGWRPGEFVAATPAGVALHRVPTGFESPLTDVSPRNARLTDLRAVKTGTEITVYGRAGNTILVRQMPPPRPPMTVPTINGRPIDHGIIKIDPPKVHRPGEPNIDPDHVRITLPVGAQRDFPYTLTLPGSRKVDLFFLVDTTDSMADKISAMKRGLADISKGLSQAKVDARFGVGQYRSYSSTPAYERLLDLAPAGPQLEAAVNGLNAAGGDHQQTSLDALYQIATGKGLNQASAFIAPGQQTHWRPDALHVILHITDEGFAQGPPHPSFEQAAAALNAENVLQIGVGYSSDAATQLLQRNYNLNTTDDLTHMARLTHAVAPPTGVDCNGDGQPDLLPGDPLVCVIDQQHAGNVKVLAKAIVNVVLAAPDFAPVSVTWQATKPVIAGVTPRVAPGVNLRFPAALTFQVTYACPAQLPAGTGYPATLTARVRSAVVAVAQAQIDCVAPPAPLLHIPPAVVAGFVSVPNPPPNPVNQPNPQSQPQQQPQTQSQAQAQVGAAHQQQEQTELAFAYMNPGDAPQAESETTTYLFSAYTPNPEPDPTLAWLGAGAAGMSAAAMGVLWARRRQIRTVPVRRSPR